MPILGITGLNGAYHDASACVVLDNGDWVAVEEERLNRIKHSSGFPALSIDWCLEEVNVGRAAVSRAGYFLDMPTHYARYFLKTVLDNPGTSDDFFCYSYRIFDYWRRGLHRDMSRWLQVPISAMCSIPHHLAHAASAYYLSPFEEAAVLSIDGAGDAETACYFHGRGRDLARVAAPLVYPSSLGMLYNFVAAHLGLGSVGSSGKLMGLAPYGRPVFLDALRRVVRIPEAVDGRSVIRFDLSYLEYHLGGSHPAFSPAFLDILGPPRDSEAPILQRHADVAASMQALLEEAVLFLARQLRLLTGSRRLCYAGGVALNIDANTRIREEAGYDEIFIMPSAYDAGTSIGGALLLHHADPQRPRVKPLEGAFKGPSYGERSMESAIRATGLPFRRVDDAAAAAAALLARGEIVGWFQGREEIGPRALGNRSILMDPGIPDGRDVINRRVKFREAFRPFAPSVPLEEADRYFSDSCPSPYMLYAFRVREEWRGRLPAITHADGSARVHTVTEGENPLFHRLLKEFGRRRGHAVLLNTSFNVQGQPLVSTPGQALAVLRHTELDALVMGPFVVERAGRRRPDPAPRVHERQMPDGVVDPGGSPAFPRFEVPPVRASYPPQAKLASADEKAFLQGRLSSLRAEAAADTERGRALRALAGLISEAESDLDVQRRLGADNLPALWRMLAFLWRDEALEAESAGRGIEDEYLAGAQPFPGTVREPLPSGTDD